MKKIFSALVALALSAPAVAQDIAPAVKRKPPTATPAPQRAASERDYQAALTAPAGQGGEDAALDTSLIQVMSRLLAAGQCSEAASLAARGGRKELASRAQKLCR